MALTGSQRRQLRAAGQTMTEHLRVGHLGMTKPLLDQLAALFARHELVKVRLPEVVQSEAGVQPIEGKARRELAESLCTAAGAECIAVVGRTVLMYRANLNLSQDK